MKNNKIKTIMFVMLFFALNKASAQQDGISAGSFTMFPSVGISFGYSDNVTRDDENEISSFVTVISPGIRFERQGERSNILLQYDYNTTLYDANSRFNYGRHHFLAAFSHELSSRSDFKIEAEYFDSTDQIGTGLQQGNFIDLGLDPDEWISFGMSGGFNLGGVGAKGSLGLELGFVDRQYQNNREFTAGRDREARYVGLTYSHQIRPKTKLLAHVKSTDIDYVWANLDSTETRLMVGAAWEITGKTEARLLVGRVEKDFDDPVHDDFSGLGWELGMTWSPKSYSIFDLSTSRETDETNGNGSYVLRQNVDLGWTHFWRERFNTTANIGFSDENYEQNFRDDNIDYMGISAKYQMKQWLLFGLGYTRYSRSSTVNEFEYNEGMFLFTIEASR